MGYKFTSSMTEEAIFQLRSIVAYISQTLSNPTAADAFLKEYLETVERLTLFPESGVLLDNDYAKGANVRKIPIKNYLVYYRVNLTAKSIRILTIIHSKMNRTEIIKDILKL